MMHYSNYGHMSFMWISQLVILILFFVVFWWVVKQGTTSKDESAEELLKKRLAAGEINLKEFKQLKKEIE